MSKEQKPDYEGFKKHIEEYESNGIPTSFKDLIRLARIYNTEIPTLEKGTLTLKFKTI